MKKILFIAICLLMAVPAAIAKTPKAPEVTEVSLVGKGVGNGGRVMIYVTCEAKKADKVTTAELARCAVHGVLFRGYNDQSRTSSFDSSVAHPALVGADQEAAHADYFNDFFNSGAASTYVDIVPDNRKVTKAGKGYQVTELVQVNVPALRKKLEKDGIIRGLNQGW